MFEGLLQPTHLVLILVIALVVFGPSKLPELGASLGKSIREFKRSTQDISEIKESVRGSVDSVKSSVTSAVALEPGSAASAAKGTATAEPAAVAAAATPLPTQPEPRHEGPVVLRRQEIE